MFLHKTVSVRIILNRRNRTMIPIQSMSCILPYKVQLQIECIISFNDFKDVINSKPYLKKNSLIHSC